MPYADRLGRFADWFVQLWAESLGKGGEGHGAHRRLGPVDQHSQLQLFMDGPRELPDASCAPRRRARARARCEHGAAPRASTSWPARRSATSSMRRPHAVAEALAKAGRPVRTFDLARLDERTIGALLMHFMLETILAGRLLGVDPFDQPAVELAKVLTRERVAAMPKCEGSAADSGVGRAPDLQPGSCPSWT